MTTKAIGLIFPNRYDERLHEMTAHRAFGSVPFGGRYRLIDFPLSNMVHGGISKVGILTKSHYHSLMDHIGSGKAWDLSRKNEGLYFLPSLTMQDDQYDGRIVPLSNIFRFMEHSKERYVVLSDCHVIGNIRYRDLIETHAASGAEITVAYRRGEVPALPDALTLEVDGNGPAKAPYIGAAPAGETACGLGIYVMEKDRLMELVREAMSRGRMNFERDIVQKRAEAGGVYGYEVTDYTRMITCLGDYYEANMELMRQEVREKLFPANYPIYTKVRDCCPAIYGLDAEVSDSLVADGSRVEGTVRHSILFRNVSVEKGAVIENCIVMQGAVIRRGSQLDCIIMDKDVQVQENRTLRGHRKYPLYVSKGRNI